MKYDYSHLAGVASLQIVLTLQLVEASGYVQIFSAGVCSAYTRTIIRRTIVT